jgi:uncharacterized protein YbjT (DUF2867 family)
VADLLRNGATARALARDVSTAQRMLEPEIVEGDLVRPSTPNPALKGAERLIVSQGVLPAPMGTGRYAFIDCSDVATVAAAVLTLDSHDEHANLASGEQVLSVDDVAAHLSNAFDRAIRYRNVPVEAMHAVLCARGVSDWQVEQIVGSAEAFVAGEVAEVTDVVARLTGHRPRSFAAFARELRAAA